MGSHGRTIGYEPSIEKVEEKPVTVQDKQVAEVKSSNSEGKRATSQIRLEGFKPLLEESNEYDDNKDFKQKIVKPEKSVHRVSRSRAAKRVTKHGESTKEETAKALDPLSGHEILNEPIYVEGIDYSFADSYTPVLLSAKDQSPDLDKQTKLDIQKTEGKRDLQQKNVKEELTVKSQIKEKKEDHNNEETDVLIIQQETNLEKKEDNEHEELQETVAETEIKSNVLKKKLRKTVPKSKETSKITPPEEDMFIRDNSKMSQDVVSDEEIKSTVIPKPAESNEDKIEADNLVIQQEMNIDKNEQEEAVIEPEIESNLPKKKIRKSVPKSEEISNNGGIITPTQDMLDQTQETEMSSIKDIQQSQDVVSVEETKSDDKNEEADLGKEEQEESKIVKKIENKVDKDKRKVAQEAMIESDKKEKAFPFGKKLKKAETVKLQIKETKLEIPKLKHHEFENIPKDTDEEQLSNIKLSKLIKTENEESKVKKEIVKDISSPDVVKEDLSEIPSKDDIS